MKKLAYIILGFIIGAVLTYYFCPRPIDDMQPMHVENRAPKDTISVEEATKLFKNWKQNNAIEIDSTLEVEGSRFKNTNVGWSLDVIKNYLAYAEAKSDSLGFTMDGIRIYNGNYGKIENKSLKNRNTLFIVPTGYKKLSKASTLNFATQGNKDLPVNPLNKGTGGQGGYP